MPREPKTTRVGRGEAGDFLAKAQQFLEAARTAAGAGRNDAAMLNVIHAAVSATDAVTVALAGRRSTDPDHGRAADLLEQVAGAEGQDVRARARQLRTLLARKNVVECESRRATAKEAADAVIRAGRLVEWAEAVVGRTGP